MNAAIPLNSESRRFISGGFFCVLLFSLLLSLFSVGAYSDQFSADQFSAEEYLDKLSHAAKEQNYRGQFVYRSGQKQNSFEVLHVVINGMEYEKLTPLSYPAKEIVRHGHNADCIHTGDQLVRKNKPAKKASKVFANSSAHIANQSTTAGGQLTSGLQLNTKTFSDNYHTSLTAGDEVAGFATAKLYIQPRDHYRYSFILWLEKVSGHILKSQMINNHGQVLESLHYTSFEFNPKYSDQVFADHQQVDVHKQHASKPVNIEQTWLRGWQLTWLPTGFNRAPELHKAGEVYKVMYTDGLSAFTLFLDPNSDNQLPAMAKKLGSANAVVRKLYHGKQQLTVTVVGEIPMMTAQKVAASLRLN